MDNSFKIRSQIGIFAFLLIVRPMIFLSLTDPFDMCLQCICECVSDCKIGLGCRLNDEGTEVCGPFNISRSYVKAAHGRSPYYNSLSYFRKCANTYECSAEIIKKYTTKFKRNCDNNREFDCRDWFRLHMMGPDRCHQLDTNSEKYKLLLFCLQIEDEEPTTTFWQQSEEVETFDPEEEGFQWNPEPILQPQTSTRAPPTKRTTLWKPVPVVQPQTSTRAPPSRITTQRKRSPIVFASQDEEDDGYYGKK